MKNRVIIPVLAFIFLSFCSGGSDGNIEAPGVVDGDIISLKSKVSSRVEKLFFSEGDSVKKGEVIAKLDSRIIEKRIDELDLKKRETELNRIKLRFRLKQVRENRRYLEERSKKMERLSEKKSVSGDSYKQIKLKLTDVVTSELEIGKSLESLGLQEALIENKRAQLAILLEDYSITSPVLGVVLEKFISEGENIFPGAALADLLDNSSVYVEIFIEERELGRIKFNMPSSVFVDGLEQRPVKGYISYIGKKAEFSPKYVISEKEREALLYRIKISFKKSEDVLKVGMPVTVRIAGEN